jgi:hypothetical protein
MLDAQTFRAYRDAMVREFGSRNLLEQTLIEQIVLAHLATFQLQASAGLAKTADEAGVYAATAAKLMGEIRRTIVALNELRSPAPPPNTIVTQQVSIGRTDPPAREESAREKATGSIELGDADEGPGANRLQRILGDGHPQTARPATPRCAD